MKQRPDVTTSERQLALALADSGRTVSLDEIASWRKGGLLPPLASYGLGTGKGKSYYWCEENILQHAQAAFDAIHRHGRNDQALISLFLSGFSVPLPQLRRAWLHRVKMRKPVKMQIASSQAGITRQWQPSTENLLMQAVICASAAMSLEDSGECGALVAMLERLLPALGFVQRGTNDVYLAMQFSHLLLVIASTLDGSDLIRHATNEELEEAQHHLGAVTRCLARNDDSSVPVEPVAPLLFVLILALLRSGQTEILDRGIGLLERRSSHCPPGYGPRPDEAGASQTRLQDT